MQELFVTALVTFFVVIDPIGVTPIFAALTEAGTPGHRRLMAIKSVAIATVVLLAFGYGGEWLFSRLHVSLDAFRIAGGVLLFLLALEMLFETRTERRESRAESVRDGAEASPGYADVSVFPMAIPMLAGPGAIASIMLFMREQPYGALGQAAIWGALGLNLVVALALFLAVDTIMKLIGHTIAAMITRILGVILAALSTQFIIDGVVNTVASMTAAPPA